MNEITKIITITAPLPKLASVEAVGKLNVRVRWAAGNRAEKNEIVDLSPIINTFKFYRALRSHRKLFRTVHLILDGRAIAWGDDQIDMPATNLEFLAEEAMSASDLRTFMRRNNVTHAELGSLLGRSRRQIENYLSGYPIPRIVALACFGYEARRQKSIGPSRELIIQANIHTTAAQTLEELAHGPGTLKLVHARKRSSDVPQTLATVLPSTTSDDRTMVPEDAH